MRTNHFLHCQPNLRKRNNLMIGEAPKRHIEDIILAFDTIGSKVLRPINPSELPRDSDNSVTEDSLSSEHLSISKPEEEDDMEGQIKVSVCKKRKQPPVRRLIKNADLKLKNKREAKKVVKVIDCTHKGPLIEQKDVNNFFEACKP